MWLVSDFIEGFFGIVNNYTLIIMLLFFISAVLLKAILYAKYKLQDKFVETFEREVTDYLGSNFKELKNLAFYEKAELLLNKTASDVKGLKGFAKFFPIAKGAEELVEDTLEQTRLYSEQSKPQFNEISSMVFFKNAYYNKIFRIIPANSLEKILASLPTLFIMGGLLCTLISVGQGIPELKNLDSFNFVQSQTTIEIFIERMSLSLHATSVGVIFAIIYTMLNLVLSPKSLYVYQVDRFTMCLEKLWNHTLQVSGRTRHKRRATDIPPPPPSGQSGGIERSSSDPLKDAG